LLRLILKEDQKGIESAKIVFQLLNSIDLLLMVVI